MHKHTCAHTHSLKDLLENHSSELCQIRRPRTVDSTAETIAFKACGCSSSASCHHPQPFLYRNTLHFKLFKTETLCALENMTTLRMGNPDLAEVRTWQSSYLPRILGKCCLCRKVVSGRKMTSQAQDNTSETCD